MIVFSIFFAILLFSLLIFIHEFGHFIAAKLSKVRVNEFSMFMGPAIFKKQKGETLYAIRCIPIGGYCAMEGEDEDTDDPHSFQKAAWWKRLIILVAGSGMNLIAGFLLLMIFFSTVTAYTVPVIEAVEPGCTIVSQDGLHEADRFVKINGFQVYTAADANLLLQFGGETMDIVVERNGEKLSFEDYPMQKHTFVNEQTGAEEERYGFSFGVQDMTAEGLIPYTWNSTLSTVQSVWISLKMLFTGQAGVKDISGPVGIVKIMSDTASAAGNLSDAIMNMVYFGGFIAINLGVMNMLPIPALDGGRCVGLLLTTGIQAVTKKKLNPKIEGYIHAGGMVLLLILMAVIMFKDVLFIFK